MESGKAVSDTNAKRVVAVRRACRTRGREIGRTAGAVVGAWVRRDRERRTVLGVSRIENRHERVQAVVRAPEPDEQDLLAVEADAAFGESALYDQRNVHERAKSNGGAGLERTIQEGPASDHVEITVRLFHMLIVPGTVGESLTWRPCRARASRKGWSCF